MRMADSSGGQHPVPGARAHRERKFGADAALCSLGMDLAARSGAQIDADVAQHAVLMGNSANWRVSTRLNTAADCASRRGVAITSTDWSTSPTCSCRLERDRIDGR